MLRYRVEQTPRKRRLARTLERLQPTPSRLAPWERDIWMGSPATIPPPPAIGILTEFAPPSFVYEEQPERATSHLAPPPSPPEIIDSADEVAEEVIPPEGEPDSPIPPTDAGSPSRSDDPPVDIPPDQIGVPQTDAEREELARSKEEAWPTTRTED